VVSAFYSYPSASSSNYLEVIGTFSYAIGGANPKVGIGYAPKQDNLRDAAGAKRDNLYLLGGLDYQIPGTPVALSAEAGYETGYFDAVSGGWQV